MRDEGSATVSAVISGLVLMCATASVFAFAETIVVRHRLAGAADLVALAAVQSPGAECDRAREMAWLNDAVLVTCSVENVDVAIEIDAPAPVLTARLMTLLGLGERRISAQARAGW